MAKIDPFEFSITVSDSTNQGGFYCNSWTYTVEPMEHETSQPEPEKEQDMVDVRKKGVYEVYVMHVDEDGEFDSVSVHLRIATSKEQAIAIVSANLVDKRHAEIKEGNEKPGANVEEFHFEARKLF